MTVFDYTVKKVGGDTVALSPQFQGLEQLYQQYKDKQFAVLGFPCNQFGNQDPGTNEEIQNFCRVNFGVTFPVMAKTEVNGEYEEPLFTFLKKQAADGEKPIKWNFTKFLVGRDGCTVSRYESPVEPEALKADIEKML